MDERDEPVASAAIETPALTIDDHQHMVLAARAVRNLAREQKGRLNARDAHETWRWALVSRGWKPGAVDAAAKTHPFMVAFDQLPAEKASHALSYSEGWDAEPDESDAAAEPDQGVTR